MNDPEGFSFDNPVRRAQGLGEAHPRVVGSPLPVGGSSRTPHSPEEDDPLRFRSTPPPPGRALASPAGEGQQSSNMDRAMSLLRMALPFVQRILPILDGNFGTAVSNILTPHPQPPPQHPPVNLEPLENGLAELHTQHRDLRIQVMEQNTSLKRVEDQLEMVREATDRNTLEQQELIEDLKTVGNKINMFAIFAVGLLAVSILLNVILLLHIQRVLP